MELPNRFVAIDRERRKLKLFREPKKGSGDNRYEHVKTYDIAVGAKGFETPTGLYFVEKKSRAKFPDWQMPYSDWVPEELQGQVIPGGDPRNPIKSRWIRLTEDGVGIHGTAEKESIGKAASHGCIRMRVPDVNELYDHVKAGTMVFID